MENCNVFLVDCQGVKRAYNVNLNQNFKIFLKSVSVLVGMECTSICLGSQIYGQGEYEFNLKQLGIKPGVDIELMSSFNPITSESNSIMEPCKFFIVDSSGVRMPIQANLNSKLREFLHLLSVQKGVECSGIYFGDRIFSQDYHEYSLREIGFRQGVEVELLSSFKGGR